MAHFAEIDNDGFVIDVIVIDNSEAPDPAPINSEPLGRQFIAAMGLTGNYVQTSYNGSFRKQYAGKGWRYIPEGDVFVSPQPYPSWTLDENYDWQAPVPKPNTNQSFIWDEDNTSWIAI